MTEEEILEYRNSYSGFLNSINEIYKSMESNFASHLDICKFAPDIDDETLKDYMNNYASKEEPLNILCVGKAKKSTGFLAGLLNCYTNFIFTPQTLYLDSTAIKFSEIDSIGHKKETKTGLFGKTKTESFLVITKKSGTAETFKGDIAGQAITEFLNAIVKAFNENPTEEIPAKEYPRSKLIKNALNDLKIPTFMPSFDHKVVNSIIIKFGKDELKASFAASYYLKKLYFSNDYLYFSSSGDWKRIPYTDLLKAVYKGEETMDSDGKIEVTYETLLYDKNDKIVFTTSDKSVNKDKKLADFFNMIISDATGTEVKTKIQAKKIPTTKKKEIQMKDIIIEEASKDKNLSAYKINGHFTDLSKNGIVPYLELENNYKAWAFCSDSIMFADGKDSWKKFAYKSLSKATLEREYSKDVKLVLYDIKGQECFSFREKNYFSTDFRVISKSLADLINKIISKLTGKVVKTECIDSRTLEDIMGSSDEFNNLLNKWKDIFSKETPIVYRKFTTDEKKKLPEWLTTGKNKFSENQNIFVVNRIEDDYVYFMGNDMRSAIFWGVEWYFYFPDLYSENQKTLVFEYSYDREEYRNLCSLYALSGDTSVERYLAYTNYNGERSKLFNNGQPKFPEKEIGFTKFFDLIGEEEFVRIHTSFKEKLEKAKEAAKEAEKQAEENAKQAAAEAAIKAKQNLMDDLNNW